MVAGGVYTPALLIVPTVLLPPFTPLTCQVTALLERLLTLAVKVTVLPSRTWLPPETVTEGCEFCGGAIPPAPQPLTRTTMPDARTENRGRRHELRKRGLLDRENIRQRIAQPRLDDPSVHGGQRISPTERETMACEQRVS